MITPKEPPPLTPPEEVPTTVESAHWTYREVAAMMRVSIQTVQKWVSKGMIPSPTYIGATARFSPEVVKQIREGTRPKGFYPVAKSVRREIGKTGGMNAPRPNEKRAAYQKANARKVRVKKEVKKTLPKTLPKKLRNKKGTK